jgi:hypothetical protein
MAMVVAVTMLISTAGWMSSLKFLSRYRIQLRGYFAEARGYTMALRPGLEPGRKNDARGMMRQQIIGSSNV